MDKYNYTYARWEEHSFFFVVTVLTSYITVCIEWIDSEFHYMDMAVSVIFCNEATLLFTFSPEGGIRKTILPMRSDLVQGDPI